MEQPAKMNGTGVAEQNQYNGGGWQNYNQNNVVPDQNHNHDQQYNLNHAQTQYNQTQQQQQLSASSAVQAGEQHSQDSAAATPELTLDPSGQWYWDYQQQQWFPYYPPQQSTESIETITQGIQQLTTAAVSEDQSREPSQEAQQQLGQQKQQEQLQVYDQQQHSEAQHDHGQEYLQQQYEQFQPEQYQRSQVQEQQTAAGQDSNIVNGQQQQPLYQHGDGRRYSQVSEVSSHVSLVQDSQMSGMQVPDASASNQHVDVQENQVSDLMNTTGQTSENYPWTNPSTMPVESSPEVIQPPTMGFNPSLVGAPPLAPGVDLTASGAVNSAAIANQVSVAPSYPPDSLDQGFGGDVAAVPDVAPQVSAVAFAPPADAPPSRPAVAPPPAALTTSPPETLSPMGALNVPPVAAAAQPSLADDATSPPPPVDVAPLPASAAVPTAFATLQSAAVPPPFAAAEPMQVPPTPPAPISVQPPSLGPPDLVDHRPNTSQPELVSDISNTSSSGSPHIQQPPRSVPPPDMFASLPSGPEHAPAPPDLTSQSVILAPHSTSSPTLVSHDQHYEFYSQAYSSSSLGMPDVTGGQQGGVGSQGSGHAQPVLSHNVKAPDILRTESVPPSINPVPSSDRNLFMETGELMEEDAVRVSHHEPSQLHSPHTGPGSFPPMSLMGAASLPPMVGGNEHYGQAPAPPLMRLVVGESQNGPGQTPPALRMVEGDTVPLLPVSREVEGESHPAPSPPQPLFPPQSQQTREPLEGQSEPLQARVVPGLQSPPPSGPPPTLPPIQQPSLLAVQVPPQDHSVPHQSPAEARSEAAGSDRRDLDVMGGPPPQVRPAPLPTPGRDIAGEESRAGAYRRDPYDSEDDRDRDSDSGDRRRYGHNRSRRTVSPGARSGHHRPARVVDRSYRSSTDMDESDRRYGGRRDDDRRQKRGGDRDRDHRSYYDRKEERRQREREEEEDRRSHRDYRTRPIKREPYDDRSSVYEDDRPHRPSRPGSRTGSVSHYGEQDQSYGYRNQWAILQQQQALLQQQYLQQQQMMAVNPLQFQLQTAVAEMEKALDTPSNVMIYKQHWDYYAKAPALLEKLKLEQPIMHHLLQHFRQNFWHLVEQQMASQDNSRREGTVSATPSNATLDTDRPSSTQTGRDTFSAQFHGSTGVEDSSIRAELEQYSNYSVDQTGVHESSSVLPARLTPLMFSRPHTCARMSAGGLLVKVEPRNPQEGQTATVEVHSLASILRDTRESQELEMFPGPLKPGVTHKNDVIKFCERKIAACRGRRDMADKESYILLWDMLVLLLRQKGQVEGSDLAELLLKGGKDGQMESRSRASSNREMEGGTHSSASSVLNEEVDQLHTVMDRGMVNSVPNQDPVDKFRSYLLHGNKVEGLEFAMKAGLWGHALFLASKMDQRTYAGVMTRFANGLAINDPLQTLYQLMSARMPSAMKQCADQRWGDWRPHLAMILSNPLPGSEINHRSMITLGDSLLAKGQLYAAQFCYIVSAAEWGTYSNKCAKLVLLLSSVADKTLDQFATTEAIQCTEIYEFVQKLGNKDFEMPYLQPYKYLHCVRLVEAGLATLAQDYVRVLGDYVASSVAGGHIIDHETVPGWVQYTAYLAEKLKYLDPVYTTSVGEISEIADPDWLVKFREAATTLQYGGTSWGQAYEQDYSQYERTDVVGIAGEEVQSYDAATTQQYDSYGKEHEGYGDYVAGYGQDQGTGYGGQYEGYDQQVREDHQEENNLGHQQQPGGYELQQGSHDKPVPGGYDQQPSELSSQSHDQQSSEQSEAPPTFFNPADVSTNSAPTFFNPAALPAIPEQTRKSSLSRQGSLSSPTPTIPSRQNSLTPRSRQASESKDGTAAAPPPSSYYGAIQKNSSPPPQSATEKDRPAAIAAKPAKKAEPAAPAPKKSWFGGIFSKIIKNDQVHLPDDKDKTIVYDEAKGRWVNLEGDDDDLAPAAPPPMDPAFSASGGAASPPGQTVGSSGPPAAPTSFRAGLGSRRGRSGYVDVLGKAGISKPITNPMLPNGAISPPTGAPPAMLNPNLPLSSNDGPTSLSTTSPYMVPDSGGLKEDHSANTGPASMPMMFNPSNMAGGGAEQPPGF